MANGKLIHFAWCRGGPWSCYCDSTCALNANLSLDTRVRRVLEAQEFLSAAKLQKDNPIRLSDISRTVQRFNQVLSPNLTIGVNGQTMTATELAATLHGRGIVGMDIHGRSVVGDLPFPKIFLRSSPSLPSYFGLACSLGPTLTRTQTYLPFIQCVSSCVMLNPSRGGLCRKH